MYRGTCAARDLTAHNRITVAASALAERAGVSLPPLLRARKGTPTERLMHQREALADLLERLVQVNTDHAAGLADIIRAATDDELLALPGIGPATLKQLREGLG